MKMTNMRLHCQYNRQLAAHHGIRDYQTSTIMYIVNITNNNTVQTVLYVSGMAYTLYYYNNSNAQFTEIEQVACPFVV